MTSLRSHVPVILVVAAAAGLLVGCSSSGSPSGSLAVPHPKASVLTIGSGGTSTGSGCATGAQTPLCDTFAFTGAVPVSAMKEQAYLGRDGLIKQCGEIALGREKTAGSVYFPVPQGNPVRVVDGHLIQVMAEVKAGHFHGAGTYGVLDLDPGGYVLIDETRYGVGPSTTASVTVNADGSGRLQFTGLAAADGSVESGSLSWTCRLDGPGATLPSSSPAASTQPSSTVSSSVPIQGDAATNPACRLLSTAELEAIAGGPRVSDVLGVTGGGGYSKHSYNCTWHFTPTDLGSPAVVIIFERADRKLTDVAAYQRSLIKQHYATAVAHLGDVAARANHDIDVVAGKVLLHVHYYVHQNNPDTAQLVAVARLVLPRLTK